MSLDSIPSHVVNPPPGESALTELIAAHIPQQNKLEGT